MVIALRSQQDAYNMSSADAESTSFKVTHVENSQITFYLLGNSMSKVSAVEESDTLALIIASEISLNKLYESLQNEPIVFNDEVSVGKLVTCESWNVSEIDENNTREDFHPEGANAQSKENSPEYSGAKVSYREMLLKPVQEILKEEIRMDVLVKAKWEPKFVVKAASNVRLDRKYGPQPDYVDEDEGMFSIILNSQ
jgi:hypothetical protein